MEADHALEYWDKALGILEAIRREELPKLVDAHGPIRGGDDKAG